MASVDLSWMGSLPGLIRARVGSTDTPEEVARELAIAYVELAIRGPNRPRVRQTSDVVARILISYLDPDASSYEEIGRVSLSGSRIISGLRREILEQLQDGSGTTRRVEPADDEQEEDQAQEPEGSGGSGEDPPDKRADFDTIIDPPPDRRRRRKRAQAKAKKKAARPKRKAETRRKQTRRTKMPRQASSMAEAAERDWYAEYHDSGSNSHKFYRAVVSGEHLFRFYGRCPQNGGSRVTSSFDKCRSHSDAITKFNDLVRSKEAKGYRETRSVVPALVQEKTLATVAAVAQIIFVLPEDTGPVADTASVSGRKRIMEV